MSTRSGLIRELTTELEEANELFAGRTPQVASGAPALPPGIDQIRTQ